MIVDEDAGRNTSVWHEFQQAVGDREWEYVFLAEEHPGIPDVEILDKLLLPGVVLLTGDCVLHMRALKQGIRSYTLNEHRQLTRRALRGIQLSGTGPRSVHGRLKDSYLHRPADDVVHRLNPDLTEKQSKRYRRARRRIRSYFGSAQAINHVGVTVGSKLTGKGLLCGFVLHLAGTSDVKGLRASEGYCLSAQAEMHPAFPVLHALRDLYFLQLERMPTELFVIPAASLDLSGRLLDPETIEPADPFRIALRKLLQGIPRLALQPCAKGRFFDNMQRKMEQLTRTDSNEVTNLDFDQIAQRLR